MSKKGTIGYRAEHTVYDEEKIKQRMKELESSPKRSINGQLYEKIAEYQRRNSLMRVTQAESNYMEYYINMLFDEFVDEVTTFIRPVVE